MNFCRMYHLAQVNFTLVSYFQSPRTCGSGSMAGLGLGAGQGVLPGLVTPRLWLCLGEHPPLWAQHGALMTSRALSPGEQ